MGNAPVLLERGSKDVPWFWLPQVVCLSSGSKIDTLPQFTEEVNNMRHDPIGLEQVWHTALSSCGA
eukprot:6699903-Ditylum_brightwellii.AAC.1